MGIQNREGALFFATGIDNTGLFSGRREAMGIIKTMMSEVTSFDVFGSLGISAAAAFAKAAKGAYDFEKQFQSSMLEIATISNEISGSLTDYMNKVVGMTKEIPVGANDAAKALYQIVSAGHDGADGMKVLEASAKAAIGGISDTATAADGITTVINAYKASADDASRISDMMFTTVKLGKTSFGELAQSIAQAAPVAAAYGVEMDQLLAAVATLTKQGTPTAQAMTQIRSAIVGVSKYLGDGAYEGRSFQEALELVRQKAGGSEAKLRAMVPEMEAVNGLLGLTGKNATEAASHLEEMNTSIGATESAFGKMRESGENQIQLLQNNITAALRPLGEGILKEVSGVASKINEAFSSGELASGLQTLETLIKLTSIAFVGYKVATMDALKTTNLEATATGLLANVKQAYHKVIGDGILEKEKDKLIQEAYTASLESSLTTEQLATVGKLKLKKGTQEYANALSAVAISAKESAEKEVRSISESLEKNREKLSALKDNVEAAKEATEAAKEELDLSLKSNDVAAAEVARNKIAVAVKNEETATTEMNTLSRRVNNQERRLGVAQTRADSAATVVNNATTASNTVATNFSTSAHGFLAAAKLKAAIAMRTLTAAIVANPIGALLTVVSLAASAFLMFGKNTEDAKTKLQEFREEQGKLKESTDNWLNTLHDTNEAERKRMEALEELRKIYPEIYNGVTLENIAQRDRNVLLKEQNILYDRNNEKRLEGLVLASRERIDGLKAEHNKAQVDAVKLRASPKVDNSRLIEKEEQQLKQLEAEYYKVASAKQKLIEESWPVDVKISVYEEELKGVRDKIQEITGKINEAATAKSQFGTTGWGESPLFFDFSALAGLEAQEKDLTGKISAAESSKKKKTTPDITISLTKEQLKERKKAQEDIAKMVLDVELKLQQDRVTAMSDGRRKALSEVEVEKMARLKAIDEEEKELEKRYKVLGQKAPEDVKANFTTRRSVVEEETVHKTSSVNKDYDKQEMDFQKELSSVFLSEEEKRMQAIKDRYGEMRKGQEEVYAGELRNIKQITDEKEANEALAKAAENYASNMSMINKAEAHDTTGNKKQQYMAMLSQLSDFKSQEEVLIYQWDEKIKNALATGNDDLVDRMKTGKEKALRELNAQMLMQSSEWIRLFGNLDTLTVEELDKLITSIQEKVDSGSLNLNPLDLKLVLEKLGEAKAHIAKINPFESLKKSSAEMKTALGELKQAEANGLTGEALDMYRSKVKQAAENVKKSIEGIRKAYEKISDVMRDVADFISMVDEGLSETVNNAMDLADAVLNIGEVVANAVISFANGMSTMETASVILLIIKAVILAVMAVINLFNNDKSHEKKIKGLQSEVDDLRRAYDKLGQSIEDAFSAGKVALLEEQNRNLLAQNEKIRQQIKEEDAKKKTDHDKIKEWENTIQDNIDQIHENSTKGTVEAIMGTEIRTALEEFASAYANAWAAGEKAAGKSANVVKSLIKTAIIGMLKDKLQPEVTKFMTFLSDAMTGGVIDAVEQKKIDEWEKQLEEIADKTLAGKEKWLKDDDNAENGVSGKLQDAMTEGTANELVGLWNMTALDIRALKEMSAEHFESYRACLIDVALILEETRKIANNTLRTADNTDGLVEQLGKLYIELAEIKKNTKSYNGRG